MTQRLLSLGFIACLSLPLAAQNRGDFRWDKALAAGNEVSIHNINGDIKVTPSTTGRVSVVGVVSNVPVIWSALLPPPCTVVIPPCDAARGVPLFASSTPGTSVLFTVNVSLPWPRKRFRTSIVDVLPSVENSFVTGSIVIVP